MSSLTSTIYRLFPLFLMEGSFYSSHSSCSGPAHVPECDMTVFIVLASCFGALVVVFSCISVCFGGDEQTAYPPSTPTVGQRGGTHENSRSAEMNSRLQPSSQSFAPTSTKYEHSDNSRRNDFLTVHPRGRGTSATAPTTPLQISRLPHDDEIEILLQELPQITCTQSEERTCAICLNSLSNTSAIVGSCCHPFHTECLKLWLRKSTDRSCPTCRTRFSIYERPSTGSV